MGLRNFLNRCRKHSESTSPYAAVWASPIEREPLTHAQLKDLDASWAELNQAIEELGATSFHACTRDGRYWGEYPDSVRAMTAIIRSLNEDTGEESQDEPGP